MGLILDYFYDMIPTLLICTPIYAVIRLTYMKCAKKKTTFRREAVMAVFCLYVLWLASETILPEFSVSTNGCVEIYTRFPIHSPLSRLQNMDGINFIPFITMRRYTNFSNFGVSAVNLIGNVVIFIPLGLLLPMLNNKLRSLWKIFLIGAASSFFVEFVQLFIGRSVDVDDIILNTTGVILGYFICLVAFKIFPSLKAQNN